MTCSLPLDAGTSSASQQVRVSMPPYMAEMNARGLDLSCLIASAERTSAAVAALKRVDVLGGWPERALQQHTTCDPAQSSALKVLYQVLPCLRLTCTLHVSTHVPLHAPPHAPSMHPYMHPRMYPYMYPPACAPACTPACIKSVHTDRAQARVTHSCCVFAQKLVLLPIMQAP